MGTRHKKRRKGRRVLQPLRPRATAGHCQPRKRNRSCGKPRVLPHARGRSAQPGDHHLRNWISHEAQVLARADAILHAKAYHGGVRAARAVRRGTVQGDWRRRRQVPHRNVRANAVHATPQVVVRGKAAARSICRVLNMLPQGGWKPRP